MSLTQTAVCKIMRASGVPRKSTLNIVNAIDKWTKHNGLEWTIRRLKQVKNFYVQRMAGKPGEITWFRMTKDRIPTLFAPVFKMRKPHKAISALMVYSSFLSKSVTQAQLDKFFGSVHEEPIYQKGMASLVSPFGEDKMAKVIKAKARMGGVAFNDLNSFLDRNIRVPTLELVEDIDVLIKHALFNVVRASGKTEPLSVDTMDRTKYILGSELRILEHLRSLPDWQVKGCGLLSEAGSLLMPKTGWKVSKLPIHDQVSGRISFIQEPGFKLRAVANPSPVLNYLLTRFGNYLYQLLKTIREDCCFNQDSGPKEIQRWILDGSTVSSVDLSDATNRFPRELIFEVLDEFCEIPEFMKVEYEVWKDVCASQWIDPFGKKHSWAGGQPLGLHPSFAAFSLAHHSFVRSCGISEYFILGDDIVVKGDASKLIEEYHRIGCKISWDKTLLNAPVAEFAGKVITKEGIYAQPKYKLMSDRNFLDLVRQNGPEFKCLLRPRQRRVVDFLAEVPSEVTPLGLNWNPLGKPYKQRVDESYAKLEGFLEIPNPARLSNLGKDLRNLKLETLIRGVSDPDIRLRRSTVGTEPTPASRPGTLKTLESIISETQHATSIPGEGLVNRVGDPRGETTLNILERKIRKSRRFSPTHQSEE